MKDKVPRGITIKCATYPEYEDARARIDDYLKATKTGVEDMTYKSLEGKIKFNPLYDGKYRNAICICGSGKKIKKCHGKDRLIDTIDYNEILDLVERLNGGE